MRRHQHGFTLIELMVGVVLAIIVTVIVMQALAVFETQKRTTTGGADSAVNGATALFQIQRDARSTGFGLMGVTGGFACPLGINLYYNGTTVADGAAIQPIQIVDGSVGQPDSIRITLTPGDFGPSPISIVAAMANASAPVRAMNSVGIVSGDRFLLGTNDGSKICTLMQASADPANTGGGFDISHASSGTTPYNPAAPASAFTTAPTYTVGDWVIALGRWQFSTYQIMCNDNAAPSATNNCDLVQYDPLAITGFANFANVGVNHVASQIVNLQAQYGVAPAGGQTVDTWTDATGAWAAPTPANMQRIKAIRVALVARVSKDEGTAVSPSSLVLWDAGQASEKTMTLTTAQQNYRYKVFYAVIPLFNQIIPNT